MSVHGIAQLHRRQPPRQIVLRMNTIHKYTKIPGKLENNKETHRKEKVEKGNIIMFFRGHDKRGPF